MQTLTASEPIQSVSAPRSKESFVTAHSNYTPKACRVDFAHFGPVSSDHPHCFFWVTFVACMSCSLSHCRNCWAPVKSLCHRVLRCSFSFIVTLASDHKASSFIGRWLTTNRTPVTFLLTFAWKVFTVTVAVLVSFACFEDFCMLAVVSVFSLLTGHKDLNSVTPHVSELARSGRTCLLSKHNMLQSRV